MVWLLNVGAALSTTVIVTGKVVNELPSTPAIKCSSEAVNDKL